MKDLPEAQLGQLALDIAAGRVFTDRHLRSLEDLSSVFMALVFMSARQRRALVKDPPGLIYEYLSEAGPRSVNGMPSFFSMRMLSKADAGRVFKLAKEAQAAARSAVGLVGGKPVRYRQSDALAEAELLEQESEGGDR